MFDIYFTDTKSKAVLSAEGSESQFLIDAPQFKVLSVGLEAGGQISCHPSEVTMYHFLEGEDLMIVYDESFAIKTGTTVVAPGGVKRRMNTKTGEQ